MATVLVVEDSPDVRELARFAIESEGYKVFLAENGKEALEILKKESPPCVILLDLMMPVMDGWEFLKIRAQDDSISNIPVVVCSAAQIESVPGCDFLKKPVGLSNLLEKLEQYCKA